MATVRNARNRVSLEILQSKGHQEEPTLNVQLRELEEETGYKPGKKWNFSTQ